MQRWSTYSKHQSLQKSQTSQRMRSASFIPQLGGEPGNAERTWSEVKTEVIRIAQRGDAKSEQARSQQQGMQGQQQGAHSVAAARMQNNKDAGQQDDDKLQLAMTAVKMLGGEIAFKHSAGRFKAPTGGTTSLEQRPWGRRGFRQAEIGRGRSPSICWYWERTEHASVGPAASGSHSYAATISPGRRASS
jgi:predicted chitinase